VQNELECACTSAAVAFVKVCVRERAITLEQSSAAAADVQHNAPTNAIHPNRIFISGVECPIFTMAALLLIAVQIMAQLCRANKRAGAAGGIA
jgi:hypothetical protein